MPDQLITKPAFLLISKQQVTYLPLCVVGVAHRGHLKLQSERQLHNLEVLPPDLLASHLFHRQSKQESFNFTSLTMTVKTKIKVTTYSKSHSLTHT